MELRDIKFSPAYDSDEDDVLNEFYIPALSSSTRYRRLAGFFSSSALAVAARGIAGLIRNGGRMELVVGAKLRKVDVEAIKRGIEARDRVIADMMIKDLDQIESEFVRDHVRALAWMVANNRLDIKVAIPLSAEAGAFDKIDEGMYHQKVGILSDDHDPENIVSFSGSVNESEMGWQHSIEEFKVFRSWMKGEEVYLKSDVEKFEKYWNGNAKRAIVVDIPTAVRDRFIEIAPETFDEVRLERHYRPTKKKLWPHQAEAVKAWVNNGYRGTFAMATGAGKTLAALSATGLSSLSMVTIVLVPTIPLLNQWTKKDIPAYDKDAHIIICGAQYEWKTLLPLELVQIRKQSENYSPAYRLYVVATMKTAATKGFLLSWKGIPPQNIQVICDEVHHLGAPTYQRCTEIPSSRRLGLSATPERNWDFEGTQKTVEYIGPTVYEYDIKSAIRDGFLCHYKYFPYFAFLNRKEFEDFQTLTDEIGKETAKINARAKNALEDQKMFTAYMTHKLERLLLERSKIRKKARDKIRAFGEILSSMPTRPLIVFCEDHEQLNEIKATLKDKVGSYLVYTSKMSLWQRNKTLDMFRKGDSDILLAIRCLDEGIDVPKCRGCIIVASSSSTREFIQRRGRILRGLRGKTAVLNDIIVLPPEVRRIDEKEVAETLVRHELTRMRQLVEAAENEWDVRNNIKRELTRYELQDLAIL